MNCKKKRTFFNLFQIYDCGNCFYQKEDEFFFIGNTNISIYYLFQDCPHLEIDKEYLYFFSKKLKRILLDAVIHQEEILLVFIEDFELSRYYHLIEQLLDFGLSLQIIGG
ncbi:MAG TPA: hypothetical protein VIK96_00090 [Bacilli bacterium]